MGGRRIIHVSYRLEGGKSVTDIGYYSQFDTFGKVGISLTSSGTVKTKNNVIGRYRRYIWYEDELNLALLYNQSGKQQADSHNAHIKNRRDPQPGSLRTWGFRLLAMREWYGCT